MEEGDNWDPGSKFMVGSPGRHEQWAPSRPGRPGTPFSYLRNKINPKSSPKVECTNKKHALVRNLTRSPMAKTRCHDQHNSYATDSKQSTTYHCTMQRSGPYVVANNGTSAHMSW